MSYRQGDFEAVLKARGAGYRIEVKYRGVPLRLRRIVLEYMEGYRLFVNPYDESIVVQISRNPPVVAKVGWRGSAIIVPALSQSSLHIALQKAVEFAEAYMIAYRANAIDRIFHED